MKYIRTKDDRIIAIPNNSKLVLYDSEKLVIDTTKKGSVCIYGIVEKKADTIEELCDEFVVISEDNKHDIYKSITIGLKTLVVNKAYLIALYGAIWTDKGLIYVAKMNKKGKFELL